MAFWTEVRRVTVEQVQTEINLRRQGQTVLEETHSKTCNRGQEILACPL